MRPLHPKPETLQHFVNETTVILSSCQDRRNSLSRCVFVSPRLVLVICVMHVHVFMSVNVCITLVQLRYNVLQNYDNIFFYTPKGTLSAHGQA